VSNDSQGIESDHEGGLRWAYVLDGARAGERLGWDEVRSWNTTKGRVWIHLDRGAEDAQAWLRTGSGVDAALCEALLAEETRPRHFVAEGGLLLILRAVNLNPGAEPDDMIAVRIWAEERRVISLRQRRLRSTYDAADEIERGRGPRDVPNLLIRLLDGISQRMEPVLENLELLNDGLEEGVTTRPPREVRQELAEVRRQLIALRRYLAPQRLALASLAAEQQLPWLTSDQRLHLREYADRTARQVEELELLREQAAVTKDELANHVAEQLNARMYLLAIVTTVFLPLGLLTGLLGINVGGMPGAQDPRAFWLVCGILAAVGGAIAALLRWLRWY